MEEAGPMCPWNPAAAAASRTSRTRIALLSNPKSTGNIAQLTGMVPGDVDTTISPGNSGDLATSFRVHGSHLQAAHQFDWVSDPLPGDPNFIMM